MIPIIILAAGLSTRFPGNKLLFRYKEISLIRRITLSALRSKADRVIVVVGHEANKIKEELKNLNITFVYNPDYMKGMSTSVKAGVKFIKDVADAVIIHPADVAFVPSEVFNIIIDSYKRVKAKIVVAAYKNIKGHPILFDKSTFNDIMKISEKTMGLKYVTRKYANNTLVVNTEYPEVTIDIDTMDDIRRYESLQSKC